MPNREHLNAVFTLIVEAAVNNERCPTTISKHNPNGSIPSGVTSALVKEGKIRVEIYAHNYRVIEILWGRNAGKRTRGPDNKHWRPYKILPKPEAHTS